MESGEQQLLCPGHTNWVRSVNFSPDSAYLLTGSNDCTARVFDVSNGSLLMVLRGHEDQIRTAKFCPNQTWILTSSDDRTARIWDFANAQNTRATSAVPEQFVCPKYFTLEGHGPQVLAADFHPEGNMVATASSDRSACIWDLSPAASGEKPKRVQRLTGHSDWIQEIQFSAAGDMMVTASADHTARVWDILTGKCVKVLNGHTSWVRQAGFSPCGDKILTASHDRTARIWGGPLFSATPKSNLNFHILKIDC